MTATTTTNEAAERLRNYLNASATVRGIRHYREAALDDLNEALAAERRATVERMGKLIWPLIRYADQAKFGAILDEEAAR